MYSRFYPSLLARTKVQVLAAVAFATLSVVGFAAVAANPSPSTLTPQAIAQSAAPTNCQAVIDVMFVVDTSGSLDFCGCNAFGKMQSFLKNAVASFNVSPGGAHIGLVDFSSDAQLVLGLSNDRVAVNRAIDTMPNFRGQTATQKGLSTAQAELDAHGRQGVAHVIILLTDGNPDDPATAAAAAATVKSDPIGIEIFGIAVNRSGDIDLNKFAQIASAPASTHVFALNNFDGFSAILQQLVVNVCPPPGADLSVVKTDSPDPVTVGSNLNYTVTVRNGGPGAATSVILTDNLPAGVNFLSANASQGNCTYANGVLTCTVGDLATGASAIATIIVVPTAAGQICNQASVKANEPDAVPNNNLASACTTVNAPASADLSVTKTDSADPVLVGDIVTYTVTVTNNGPNTATGVLLTDTLPAGVNFISANSTRGNCSHANGIVTCSLGDMASGVVITVTVAVTPAVAGQLCDLASVRANEADPNVANNSATECTTVNAPINEADLSISKTASPDPVLVGGQLTYRIAITNLGPATATGVIFTDPLPAGSVFVSANASQGSVFYSNGTITGGLGNLAGGATATVTLVITPGSVGQPTNCQAAIDLIFVVDTSGSLDFCGCNAFGKMQSFLKNVVVSFNVSPGGAHIGLVDFSSDAQLTLGLSDDPLPVNRAIDTMPNFRGETATQKGLSTAQAELDAHGRPGVAHVIILLTDGDPDDPATAAAAATGVKNDPIGIEIFGIAVNRAGDIDLSKFGQIASAPSSTHVFALNNFDGLAAILGQLLVNLCQSPTDTIICNTATVKANEPDPDLSNNTATVCTRIVSGLPKLAIARGGTNAVISWSASANGFALESTGSLSPIIQWRAVPGTPVVVGGRNTVTVDASRGSQFYRLRKP